METNKRLRRADKRDKRERFSIRKFNVGVASVAVAAFWLVTGSQAVAAEQVSTATTAEVTTTSTTTSSEEETSEAETETEGESAIAPKTDETSEVTSEASAPAEKAVENKEASEPSAETAEAKTEEASKEEAKQEGPKVEETAPSTEAKDEVPVAESRAALPTRDVATTYRVQYIDEETGEQIKQQNYSVSEKSSTPAGQPHTFNITVKLDLPEGYVAVGAANNAGTAFDVVNNAIAAAIVERDSSTRTLKVTVRRENAAAPAPETGSGFRSTVPVTDATAPAADGSGSKFDTAAIQAIQRGTVSREEFFANQQKMPDAPQYVGPDFGKTVRFFDFSDSKRTAGPSTGGLTVGTTWENEVYPGYVVRVKVTELKPLEATPEYLEMAKEIDRINGTDYATTVYDPNATNGRRNGGKRQGTTFNANAEASWHEIASNGLRTGSLNTRLTPNTASGASTGVRLEVHAVINGQEQPIDILTTDGESLTNREITYATTNGENWELYAELNGSATGTANNRPRWMVNTPELFADAARAENYNSNTYNGTPVGGFLADQAAVEKYNPQAYINPYPNAGLGTKMLGGYFTVLHSYPGQAASAAHVQRLTSPIFMTRNATEIGFFVNAAGAQSVVLGFLVPDRSDAPDSYGIATHSISETQTNGTPNQQPYLGTVKPDIDDTSLDGTAFYFDDDSLGKNQAAVPDEGEEQLVGQGKRYAIVDGSSTTFSLPIKASAGGAEAANIKGWIDFNNNGEFDANEGSAVVTVSGNDQDVVLTFQSADGSSIIPADVDVSKLAARVRIAMDATQIARPTGFAATGEVEDFQVIAKLPPKGTYEHTEGLQGQKQTGTLNFTASGTKITEGQIVREQTLTETNTMKATDFGIVDPASGALVQNLTTAQGTYTIVNGNGGLVTIDFQPVPSFTGVADGVIVRATDANGLTTNWANANTGEPNTAGTEETAEERAKANLKTKTWDSLYIPEVKPVTPTGEEETSTGKQGQEQSKRLDFFPGAPTAPIKIDETQPAKFLNEAGDPIEETTVPATDTSGKVIGSFELDKTTGDVTFKPNKDYTGDVPVKPIKVQAKDVNGTPATSTYTPTVTPVTPTAAPETSEGPQGQEQKKNAKEVAGMFTRGDDTAPINTDSITLLDESNAPVKEVPAKSADGNIVGKYVLNDDKSISFIPNPDYTGASPVVPVKVQAADKNGTTVDTTYTPKVTPVTPTAEPARTTDKQGVKQSSDADALFKEGDKVAPIQNDTITLLGADGQPTTQPVPATIDDPENPDQKKTVGTYTLVKGSDGQVTVEFQPNPDFVGTADPVKLRAADKNGTTVDTTYTPTVTPITPTGTPDETTGLQGQPQTSELVFTPGDATAPITITEDQPAKFIDPATKEETNAKELPAMKDGKQVGTYTIDPTTGQVTFQPNPTFVGTPDPITVQVKDANGTPATAAYTPTVTPVTPTAKPDDTTGPQGKSQTSELVFIPGNSETPITINEQQPAKFIDPATKEETDAKELPAMKDGKQVGTYTIDPTTGQVTFTPNPDFVGTPDPITVQVKDANGTPATAKYTPTVTPVKPTAEPARTTDKQGVKQSSDADALFKEGDKVAPIQNDTITLLGADGNPTDQPVPATIDDPENPGQKKTVGTYSLVKGADGQVTVEFQPNPDFVGTADPVKLRAADKNGTTVDTTYTPTVTPITPTGTPDETTGLQGQPQTSELVFTPGDDSAPITITEAQPAKFIDPTTGKETDAKELPALKDGKEVGKYTIDPTTGQVTFTPNPDFVGTPDPITVQVKDANGTPATAKYTPTVTPVKPTGTPDETTGLQGQPQTSELVFTPGDDSAPITITEDQPAKFIDPATGKETDAKELPAVKDGKQVGKYTINPATGQVTFEPNSDFVGTPDPITVQVKDANGTPATAKYTPTVTPVKPTAEPARTTDKQGVKQSSDADALFKEGDKVAPIQNDTITLLGADGNPTDQPVPATIDDPENPGQKKTVGTYSLVKGEDGQVTVEFQPNPDFVGTADPVKLRAADKNGTTVDTTYTPTVTPVTPTAEPATTEDKQGVTQNTVAKVLFKEGDAVAPIDNSTITLVDAGGKEVKELTVPGEGTYTLKEDGTIDFKPEPTFTGTATPVTVKAKDENGTPVTTTYTPKVTPVTPTAEPAETTDVQGKKQNGTPTFTEGDAVAPINKDSITLVNAQGEEVKEIVVPGEGTYTLKEDGSVDFQPEPTFTGRAKGVTVKAKDTNGTPVETTYTPTVTPVRPTAEPAETTDKQGVKQTGKPEFKAGNDAVPMNDTVPATFEDGTTEKVVPGEGTYTVAPDGTVTFTPEKTFTGRAKGVTVKRVDTNGTPATATYTPTVTPVRPTAEPAETTDVQGKKQNGTPTFTAGDAVAPINKDSITLVNAQGEEVKEIVVPGEGTYTLKEDGSVDFQPEPTFTGRAKGVTVKAKDTNGTPVETTYTPTVTPVRPTAEPAETTDIQGAKQTGKPEFKAGNDAVPMDDTVPATFEDGTTEKVVPGEGTYTVAPDGTVTFTPEETFTGRAKGVTVKRVDTNGTPATATYTPTVTPVTPTGEPKETTGPQGEEQSDKPVFKPGNEAVPMDDTVPATFEDGTTEKTVPGEGVYTVAPDGTVTFSPEKNFTGRAKGVTVKRVDTNGTPATATYTPTVTPVVPTGTPVETTDLQGKTQTGKPVFEPGDESTPIDLKEPATFEDGTTEKVVPGEGTYTVSPDGVVTFVPEKDFTGRAKGVTVKRVDNNGTPVTADYIPTVTPVTPKGEPETTKDVQGKPQSAKVEFTPGNEAAPMDDTVPATFEDGTTEKVVPGEGTYTVAPDGTVTFTPEENFTGKGTGVTVVRQDVNGTKATATYTPEVTPKTTSYVDEAGKSLIPTVDGTFDPAKLADYYVKETKVDEATGNVTHVYAKKTTEHVTEDGTVLKPKEDGTNPTETFDGYYVKETKVDENGNITHVYVKKTTEYVTEDGTVLKPKEDGTLDPSTFDGYYVKETKVDEKGNVTHVYAPVQTTYVDEAGKPLKEPANGQDPNAPIEGYEIVSSVTDPETGNVRNVYKKVPVTTYVDLDGNVISPEKAGSNPNEPIEGYEIVTSVTDKDGNVRNVYKKTVTPTTTFVDESGNPIKSPEEGTKPNVPVEGYTIVSSTTDKDGNVVNVYRKVVTPATPVTTFVDEAGNPIKTPEEGQKTGVPVDGYTIVSTTIDPVTGNVKNVYKKVVPPTTTFVDENGNPIKSPEEGTNPNVPVEGYEIVSVTTDKDGNVKNVYRKVTPPSTTYVDENGNPIQDPTEGQHPNAPIEGYKVVLTVTDAKGNVVNVYKKVVPPTTTYVDENGKQIQNPTQGQDPNAPIEGYEIVSTTTDPDGNVVNVYKMIPTPNTTYVDEAGNTISPRKDGQDPNAPLPGYEIVSTRTDEAGNVVNVYRKIVTPTTPSTIFVDVNGNPIKSPEEGAKPNVPIEGYELVSSVPTPNGDVVNTYKKVVKTSYVDEAGNPIQDPTNGQNPNAPISGYEIVSTETDADGNVKNVYRKVTPPSTTYVDENGNPIQDPTQGQNPNAPISGYELVSTETDAKGNVKNVYRKVTPPSTTYVDENGNPIQDPTQGQNPNAPISGYELVSTETDAKGNVKNVYRKVTPPSTTYVDENGNPIQDPTQGQDPNAPIPGYEIVSTTTDKDGNVINVYRKVKTPSKQVVTSFLDENGNPIQVTEGGSHPNAPIPGYEIVSTTTDKDGNVINVYRKVKTPSKQVVTSFLDENGHPIQVTEGGSHPNAPIPGYEIVSTTTDKDGNVINVYRKVKTPSKQVVTSFLDENGHPIQVTEGGSHPNAPIPGYEIVSTTTDKDGNVINVYRKVKTPAKPATPETPVKPVTPAQSEAPKAPVAVAQPAPKAAEKVAKALPSTGDSSSLATLVGTSLLTTALGLVALRRRKKN